MAAAADRNHVNTSCGDTVKCRLDAGKSPIFRSQSPCTDISVRKSQRVTIFVRIYPYKSLKGLNLYLSITSTIFKIKNLLILTVVNLGFCIKISFNDILHVHIFKLTISHVHNYFFANLALNKCIIQSALLITRWSGSKTS